MSFNSKNLHIRIHGRHLLYLSIAGKIGRGVSNGEEVNFATDDNALTAPTTRPISCAKHFARVHTVGGARVSNLGVRMHSVKLETALDNRICA